MADQQPEEDQQQQIQDDQEQEQVVPVESEEPQIVDDNQPTIEETAPVEDDVQPVEEVSEPVQDSIAENQSEQTTEQTSEPTSERQEEETIASTQDQESNQMKNPYMETNSQEASEQAPEAQKTTQDEVKSETRETIRETPLGQKLLRPDGKDHAIERQFTENLGAEKTPFELIVQDMGHTPSIDDIEITESLHEFYNIRKHFLVLTDAGKPLYTRYGDENLLAPFFATIGAVIPKIQSYYWDNTKSASKNKNKLHALRAGEFKVYFVQKGALIYLCLFNEGKKSQMGTYFLDDLFHLAKKSPQEANHILDEYVRPYPILENSNYIQLQLEYMHLQMVSILSGTVLKQLIKRPNLDLKASILGLEKTIDMMCEVSNRSPSCFLQAYPPLRLPQQARKIFNDIVTKVPKPAKLAFGMIVTALNVINVFSDEVESIKAEDVSVIFNYIWSLPSIKNGETWTPICLPGCSEDFMLHVYTCFTYANLGIILVNTDHTTNAFEQCHKFRNEVWKHLFLPNNKFYAGANKPSLQDAVDKCTIQMHEITDMKEVQCVIVRDNYWRQYSTYNYPFLSQTNHRHASYLRRFNYMKASYMAQVQKVMESNKFTFFEAQKYLALKRSTVPGKEMPKKASSNMEVVAKEVHSDFTLAMVNWNSAYTSESKMVTNIRKTRSSEEIDITLFICYDHRKNDQLEKIAKNLIGDITSEIKNIFVPLA